MKTNTGTRLLIDGGQVLVSGTFSHRAAIDINAGKIVSIKSLLDEDKQLEPQCGIEHLVQYRIDHGTLVAGFIDTQVNGGGGLMFNHKPTLDTLKQMMQAHCQFGTTAMLPTIITDDINIMQSAADAVAQAIRQQTPGIIGIHFEGPHLSIAKRGCHPQAYLRPITAGELQIYKRQDLGVRLITLAPETVAPAQIKELVASGAIVSLGHSNANAIQVQAAIDAGATGFTHLYNGMSAMTSREPGMVGTALVSDNTYCGIILDGQHVHAMSAQVAWRAKGSAHLMLVTDAMSPVGTQQTEFAFFDGKVTRDGMVLRDQHGSLAGSVLDMASAVNYAANTLDLGLAAAIEMATSTPASFLQLPHAGDICVGKIADVVWLDDDLNVLAVWIAGQLCYQADSVHW